MGTRTSGAGKGLSPTGETEPTAAGRSSARAGRREEAARGAGAAVPGLGSAAASSAVLLGEPGPGLHSAPCPLQTALGCWDMAGLCVQRVSAVACAFCYDYELLRMDFVVCFNRL